MPFCISNMFFAVVPREYGERLMGMRVAIGEELGFSLNMQGTSSLFHALFCGEKSGIVVCTFPIFPILMRSWKPCHRVLILPVDTTVSSARLRVHSAAGPLELSFARTCLC